jgi:ABC-type siderophore export system fused ATPase/permease subunit
MAYELLHFITGLGGSSRLDKAGGEDDNAITFILLATPAAVRALLAEASTAAFTVSTAKTAVSLTVVLVVVILAAASNSARRKGHALEVII